MSDEPVFPRVETVRPDLLDLAQKGAEGLLKTQEEAERKAAFEGPPEKRKESWGIVAKLLWTGPAGEYWRGDIVGTLPGADGPVTVYNRTREGLVAKAHRAYLAALTGGCVCDAKVARVRAAEAEFYIATVV